jgi:hypothetical protein
LFTAGLPPVGAISLVTAQVSLVRPSRFWVEVLAKAAAGPRVRGPGYVSSGHGRWLTAES